MARPGFHFGWALGLVEMVGTCVCSALERWARSRGSPKDVKSTRDGNHVMDYTILVACLMTSSSLSNIALNYINFPTKARSTLPCPGPMVRGLHPTPDTPERVP